MKKILLLISFFVFWIATAVAQQVEISGTQRRLSGRNAELESQKVKIAKTMTIVSVTGNNNGFWITKNGKSEKAFWTEKQTSDAVGYKLSKGEYQVFPNLKTDENLATVTIKLK
ncbi:MAG: hypothetical protein IKR94_04740 [Bacteroidales bacterium]|nr:hypothetical protein [Bacteroidales bacterium]MBR4214610.1 hypothetical protein [Bacteroidales bacterium]